jgi:hypothetical protein
MLVVKTFNINTNALGWLKHQRVKERNTTVGMGTPHTPIPNIHGCSA